MSHATGFTLMRPISNPWNPGMSTSHVYTTFDYIRKSVFNLDSLLIVQQYWPEWQNSIWILTKHLSFLKCTMSVAISSHSTSAVLGSKFDLAFISSQVLLAEPKQSATACWTCQGHSGVLERRARVLKSEISRDEWISQIATTLATYLKRLISHSLGVLTLDDPNHFRERLTPKDQFEPLPGAVHLRC